MAKGRGATNLKPHHSYHHGCLLAPMLAGPETSSPTGYTLVVGVETSQALESNAMLFGNGLSPRIHVLKTTWSPVWQC
jgi:hypothetical protein